MEKKKKKYSVNVIFYSLQGEGARTGTPMIFFRVAGCNLACPYCDTDFKAHKMMTLNEIHEEFKKWNCKSLSLCGGEPALQIDEQFVKYFKERGYTMGIETNGTKALPEGIDYIVCSPKKYEGQEMFIHPYFQTIEVDELRFPIEKGEALPKITIRAKNVYLSPIFDFENPIQDNIDYCIQAVLENPPFKMSQQIHKLWKVE